MNLQEEQLLIKRAQAGDRQALGVLWDTLTPKLFGYLINVTRDRALAEDLLQSTWLRAINGLASFKLRDVGFGAWLFAIARNECRQYWRKQKREVSFDPAEHDQPDTGQENFETKIAVKQALDLLSEEDRELVRLRYIVDLSIRDIALILKLNSVTVRVRIYRAIARLRDAIVSNKS